MLTREDPERDDDLSRWPEFHEALEPYAADWVYVDLLAQDGEDRIPEAYGEWYGRHREVNAEWDSEYVFQLNHNISHAD